MKMPPDFDQFTREVVERVKPFTMTSPERIHALCASVAYVVKHDIEGDIVECGVWRGGSMMAVALTLKRLGANRRLHLFDTFEGMTDPTDVDRNIEGRPAAELLATDDKATGWNWAYSPMEEVQRNLRDVDYDESLVRFCKGKVEETLPEQAPQQIAILRLDTDWYESTYHELTHLYPRVPVGGVVIIDDYGHWDGARMAVDQYLEENELKVLLNRIDYTGRSFVKIEP